MRGSLNTARGECRLSPFMARFAWLRFWCSPHAALRNPLRPPGTSAPARRPSRISQEPLSPLLRCPPVPTFSPLISEILLTQAHLPHPLRTTNCRSEEHTSELQSHSDLVCRLLLEKKK